MIAGQDIFNYIGIDMGWVVLGLAAVYLLMLILILVLFVKNSKLKKKYNAFMAGEDGRSLEKIMLERFDQIDNLNGHMEVVDGHLNKVDQILMSTYKKMALIKYDAFQEMGGGLSFVLVMLTAGNNGFVLNSVHSSREGSYIYAKKVVNGECSIELSEEEAKALQQAMHS